MSKDTENQARMRKELEPTLKKILKPNDGYTRRTAMQFLGSAGITGVMAGTLIGQASQALAQTPVKGGKLTVALEAISPTDTFDPARLTSSSDFTRGMSFFNGLTRIDENNLPTPELAESWEVDGDARNWVFRIREGVEFSNGKTLDSDDVAFSLMRHKLKEVGSSAKALADQMEEVTTDGNGIVRVRLSGPNADFPLMLSTYQFMITPADTTDFSTPVGTGPLVLKEFTPGVRTIGERNPNYWKEGAVNIDEMELIGIGDANARVSALLSGDVDMIQSLPPAAIDQLASSDAADSFRTNASHILQLVMMVDREPTSNKDLRRALQLMMDRERFIQSVLRGNGQLGNDHTIPPNHPLYNTELPQREVDLDQARFHLRQAGMENGTLEIHVSGAAENSEEIGLILQQQGSLAGLNIELRREPSDGYWSNIWGKRAAHGGEWFPRPTPDMLLSLGWVTGGAWNDTGIANARLDELIVMGRGEVEPNRRRDIYWEIQAILHEDGGNLIPAFKDFLDAKATRVKNLTPIPVAGLGNYYMADTVWLDDNS